MDRMIWTKQYGVINNWQAHHVLMLSRRLFDLETLLPCNSGGEAGQTFADPIKPKTKTTLKKAERLTSLFSRWAFESENWKTSKPIIIIWICVKWYFSKRDNDLYVKMTMNILQDPCNLGLSHFLHLTGPSWPLPQYNVLNLYKIWQNIMLWTHFVERSSIKICIFSKCALWFKRSKDNFNIFPSI